MEDDFKLKDITSKIIGACIEVHKCLGPGFMEVVYQRALARELFHKSIDYLREQWMTIYYKGISVGKKRIDFIIEGVLVEIKAKSELAREDYVQALSYLKGSSFEVGLLINFGTTQVQIKRLVHSDKSRLYK